MRVDELFAGYPWRYYRAVTNSNFDDFISKYFDFWQRLLPKGSANRIFSPIAHKISGTSAYEIFRDVFPADLSEPNRPEDYINLS